MEKKVYTVNEIREILGLSKTKAYEFVKIAHKTKDPFPVIKIGNTYRIQKEKFDEWFERGEF